VRFSPGPPLCALCLCGSLSLPALTPPLAGPRRGHPPPPGREVWTSAGTWSTTWVGRSGPRRGHGPPRGSLGLDLGWTWSTTWVGRSGPRRGHGRPRGSGGRDLGLDMVHHLCREVGTSMGTSSTLAAAVAERHRPVRRVLTVTWSDGTSALDLSPLELCEKLAALVPPPRANQVVYAGVLAGNASWRAEVVPKVPTSTAAEAAARAARRLVKRAAGAPVRSPERPASWAEILRRMFGLDGWSCPRCDAFSPPAAPGTGAAAYVARGQARPAYKRTSADQLEVDTP
jgi:hypothetical protein